MTTRPHYLRATVISVLCCAIIPVLTGIFAYLLTMDDPFVKGSEVQGAIIFFVHAVMAILFVAIGFPIVAYILYRREGLSKYRFYKTLFIVLVGVCTIPASILTVISWEPLALVLVMASVALTGILSLPFMPLWFLLAQ